MFEYKDFHVAGPPDSSLLGIQVKWLIHVVFSGTVRIWHSSTYRLESTLNYGMERVWCVASMRGSNNVALGYDEGSIIVKVISHCTVSE